jgi:hypothetical protein
MDAPFPNLHHLRFPGESAEAPKIGAGHCKVVGSAAVLRSGSVNLKNWAM